jgi:hypothetical protein
MLNKYQHKLPDIIAALLILLFCYTGINKLMDHYLFEIVIGKSELIGKMSGPISWTVPFLELALAVLLIVPRSRETGFMMAFSLLILFTVYILYMLLFASVLPCSCGGVLKTLSWPEHIVFNIFFATLAFIGWLAERRNKRFIQNPVH